MTDPMTPDPEGWVELESSNIARVQWMACEDERGSLCVEFLSGSGGFYAEVPWDAYDALLEAGSAGAFLHSQIKPHYPYTKVR
jgi:hypothetical protein